jgi:hypothetical protein
MQKTPYVVFLFSPSIILSLPNKNQNLKRHFVKAGALTFAVFLMLVTLIVIGTLITIAFYHHNYINKQLARQNLLSYSQSVLTAALTDSTLTFPWDGKSLNLTEDENYTFKVTKEPWGAYLIFHVLGSYGNFNVENRVLCGTKGFMDDAATLYLTDNNNALSISGTTQLMGDCYLPKAGIKASYMEGDYYRGKQLVYGEIKVSSNTLPTLDESYQETIRRLIAGKLNPKDSVLDFSKITSNEISHSFRQKTLYLISKEPLYLTRCKFEGNILIICSQPITVFEDATLSDVILAAPKITFKEGWTGSIQAYAQDTLLIEENVHFTFPSTLGIQSPKNVGLLQISENSRIDGNLWMTKNPKEKENKNMAVFEKGILFQGIAYVEGKFSLRGKINGSLYVEKFLYKTPSSYYENHLYNVEINIHNLLPYFSSAVLNPRRGCRAIKVLEP